jgi:hypothetical protein
MRWPILRLSRNHFSTQLMERIDDRVWRRRWRMRFVQRYSDKELDPAEVKGEEVLQRRNACRTSISRRGHRSFCLTQNKSSMQYSQPPSRDTSTIRVDIKSV